MDPEYRVLAVSALLSVPARLQATYDRILAHGLSVHYLLHVVSSVCSSAFRRKNQADRQCQRWREVPESVHVRNSEASGV